MGSESDVREIRVNRTLGAAISLLGVAVLAVAVLGRERADPKGNGDYGLLGLLLYALPPTAWRIAMAGIGILLIVFGAIGVLS
jgi:hypothetical protein